MTVEAISTADGPLDLVGLAIRIAASAHAHQLDKCGQSYILHPLRVGMSLSQFSEDAMIAGFLHDVIEDTEWGLHEIAGKGFSFDVVEALRLLTHLPGEPYVEYIAKIKTNDLATHVKLADIADNTLPWRIARLDIHTVARLNQKYDLAVTMLTKL